ncbi:MAG: MGMT family protein [Oscillospiraceae bacterium]|jgi:methylated-DNA-protein-cysteine methyltransferase-like protein|nr:MGMT family protein [Oscillospiraceae bacterium]
MSVFYEQVYETVMQIPYGSVVCYGDIAKWLNHPRGAQVVGWAMSALRGNNRPEYENIPWHRVVKADGSIADGGAAEMRRSLLEDEGIEFLIDGRIDMERYRWVAPPGVDRRY